MTFATVAIGIGVAGALGAGASIYGARQQSKAANNASNLQAQQFDQTQTNLTPYMQTGNRANQQLQAGVLGPSPYLMQPFGLNQFQQSPDYQFNLQQGQQAIDKAANARGNYYAPQTLQDTAKFSQGLASQEFQQAYNMYNQNQQNQFGRLSQLSGAGQNAAANLGGFGQNSALAQGNYMTQGANAQAAGIMGAGASLSQLGYLPLLQQQFAMQQAPTYAGGFSGSPDQFGYSGSTGLSTMY